MSGLVADSFMTYTNKREGFSDSESDCNSEQSENYHADTDDNIPPPTVSIVDERIAKAIAASRLEQVELMNWLSENRGKDTLNENSAAQLFATFIWNGCCTLKDLKDIRWDDLTNMGLKKEELRWLSAWRPLLYSGAEKEEYPDLTGKWVDEFRGRCAEIVKTDSKGALRRHLYHLREEGETKSSVDFNLEDWKVTLKAPWGKNGEMRVWNGRVLDDRKTIEWQGRCGKSHWFRA